jgi:glyoxylase-like metal-dependent hydrolase (beta-lactamase superfamily II)
MSTSITRRILMAGAPVAALATSMNGTAMAQSPAVASAASGSQAPGFYRFKIGDIEVTAVNDGFARRPLDGFVRNAELDDVKKAMAERFLPTDALPIPFTTLVLRTGGKTVLIDTGNGDSGAPTSGSWMANFKAAGFDPAAVDTVVISHFHGDHINGMRLKDGTAVFPKAQVLVPEAEWAFWMDDGRQANPPEALKGGFAGVKRVFGPIAKDVERFADGKEVVPGVTAIATHGHTPGHTSFRIASGDKALVAMSDVTNHPALFVRNPDWSAVFDMDADMARATRKRMLEMAATDRVQVSFYHAPFPATGHIAKEGGRYSFVPVQWMPVV